MANRVYKYQGTAVRLVINVNGSDLAKLPLGIISEDSFIVFTELFATYYIQSFEKENVFSMYNVSFENALELETVYYVPGEESVIDIDLFLKTKKDALSYCVAGEVTHYDQQYIKQLENSPLVELISAAKQNNFNIMRARAIAHTITNGDNNMGIIDESALINKLTEFTHGESRWDQLIDLRCMNIIIDACKNKFKEI